MTIEMQRSPFVLKVQVVKTACNLDSYDVMFVYMISSFCGDQ